VTRRLISWGEEGSAFSYLNFILNVIDFLIFSTYLYLHTSYLLTLECQLMYLLQLYVMCLKRPGQETGHLPLLIRKLKKEVVYPLPYMPSYCTQGKLTVFKYLMVLIKNTFTHKCL
jgi:hypothetical protein